MTAEAHFDASQGALIASGDWHADAASALPTIEGHTVRILDGAAVTRLDTNGAWLLLNAARPRADDPIPELRGFQPRHRALLELVAQHFAPTAAHPELPRQDMRASIGRGAFAIWRHAVGLVGFIGQLTTELALLIGKPGSWRWRELGAQVNEIFAGAIPIVIGMMFLLGVVFAYLLGAQAQQYGASIFVVDGLLLAILREISPVIVAVLVAGRTGAAITAQLGILVQQPDEQRSGCPIVAPHAHFQLIALTQRKHERRPYRGRPQGQQHGEQQATQHTHDEVEPVNDNRVIMHVDEMFDSRADAGRATTPQRAGRDAPADAYCNTTSTTRRFLLRPSRVALSATGWRAPKPTAFMRCSGMPAS